MADRRSDAARDERFLAEFVISDDPAFFTSELATRVGLSRQQAQNRLEELERMGLVESKFASNRNLWWLTDEGEAFIVQAIRQAFQT